MNLRVWFFIAIATIGWLDTIAQNFSNSWINYDQPYIKLSVREKGIQRISLDSLSKAGLPVKSPERFQLFHRGKPVELIGVEENNLLFYGEPNDGALDSLLFRPMSSRINPYFSYYTDLGSYILTVSDKEVNVITSKNIPINATMVPQKYHVQDLVILANTSKTDYSNGVWQIFEPMPAQSYFSDGETMTGPAITGSEQKTYTYALSNRIVGSGIPAPTLEVMINGRNNIGFDIELKLGKRTASNFKFQGFKGIKSLVTIIPETDLNAGDTGSFSLMSKNSGTTTRYSLTYHKIKYAQAFNMSGILSNYFNLDVSPDNENRITITNAPKNAIIYDVTDPYKIVKLNSFQSDNNLEVMVPRIKGKPLSLYVTNEFKKVTQITPVTYKKINPESINYIIITNSLLKESAETYANYRQSAEGGSYKPLIVDIKDVYNQFSYGEPHPVAIRNFVNFIVNEGGDDKYLLLIGKHLAPARYITKEIPNEIPSVGFPGSDVLLVSGLKSTHSDVEVMPIGRISASSNELVINYLNKVKEFEAGTISDRKTVLHLNGGKSASEITQFKNLLESLSPLVNNAGGNVIPFVKQSNIEVEPVDIAPEVNKGVGLISYFGHGSPTVTDLDLGYASKTERGYLNKGKYPLMYFNGCGVGNIFNSYTNPLSTDWVLTKDKGAVALIANSHLSYYSSSASYIEQLYKEIFSAANSVANPKTIGIIHKNVAEKISQQQNNAYEISNLHQAVLQGDPALKITFSNLPDYSIEESDIFIQSKNLVSTILDSDSLRIKVIISNLGKINSTDILSTKLEISYKGSETKLVRTTNKAIAGSKDSLIFIIPNTGSIEKLKINLDPNNSIKELSKLNNNSEIQINWDEISHLVSFPEEILIDLIPPLLNIKINDQTIVNKETIPSSAQLSINLTDNNILNSQKARLQIFLKNCWDNTCEFEELSFNPSNFLNTGSSTLKYNHLLTGLSEGNYELLVRGWDNQGNMVTNPFHIQFRVQTSTDRFVSLIVSPNPATNYVKFQSSIEALDNKPATIKIQIFNTNGRLMDFEDSASPEWYWFPKNSGTYVYKIVYTWQSGYSHKVSGKIVILK